MITDMASLQKMSIESLNEELVKACAIGSLEQVQTLLTSNELKRKPSINANNEHALRFACNNNHIEIIKYLITSPEIEKHADVHAAFDTPFKSAINNNSQELLHFYIFELNIEKTLFIENALIEYAYRNKEMSEIAKKMFNTRELREELNSINIKEKNKPKL